MVVVVRPRVSAPHMGTLLGVYAKEAGSGCPHGMPRFTEVYFCLRDELTRDKVCLGGTVPGEGHVLTSVTQAGEGDGWHSAPSCRARHASRRCACLPRRRLAKAETAVVSRLAGSGLLRAVGPGSSRPG